MEFSEVVRRRRMVRRYDPDRPVPEEVLARCLEHAVRAPSAGFSQGWDFVVLTDAADRAGFWAATAEDPDEPDAWLSGLMTAPVLVVCCSDKQAYLERYAEPDKGWGDRDEARWPVAYWDVDTGMASLLILLAAVDAGLGGLFFGVPPECHDAVHDAFAIPRDRTLVGALALGYAAPPRPGQSGRRSASRRRRHRTAAEVTHRGRFGVHDA